MDVLFHGEKLSVTATPYVNKSVRGQIALQLWSEEGPYAMATVAVQGAVVPQHCVIIKGYSENMGMVQALDDAGIIDTSAVTYRYSGYVTCPVYKLTDEAVAALL